MNDNNLLSPSIFSETRDFEKDIKSLAPYFEALEAVPVVAWRSETHRQNGESIIQHWLMENCRAFVKKYEDLIVDIATENFVNKRSGLSVRSLDGREQTTISSKDVIKLNLTMAVDQKENATLADAVSLSLVMFILPSFADVKYSSEAANAALEVAIFNSEKYRKYAISDLLNLGNATSNKRKKYSWLMWAIIFFAFNSAIYLMHK